MRDLNAVEVEELLIGCCLLDSELVVVVAGIVNEKDFSDESLGTVWSALKAMREHGEHIDVVTICEWLEDRELLQVVGGQMRLLGFISGVPNAYYATSYAKIVVEKSRRRRSLKLAGEYARWVHDPDVADPDARMIAALVQTADGGDGLLFSDDAWDSYLQLLEYRLETGGLPGVETGLVDLDLMIGGLRPGHLVVVGARPHCGKTTLLEQIADNVAQAGARVLFASMEMRVEELQDRRVVRQSGLDKRSVESGQVIDEVITAVGALQPYQIDYLDDGGLTTDRLLSVAYRVKNSVGLGLVVVDYFQLLADLPHLAGKDETARMSFISRRLKLLARELEVPVVVASQLNRSVEARRDKRPLMSDLRQSGRIEEDADVVMLLYREGYYNELVKGTADDVTECRVVKNRADGHTGLVTFGFVNNRVVSLVESEAVW